MMGNQRLVRTHHMFAVFQRRGHQIICHAFMTTNQLHHHIHIGGAGQCQRIAFYTNTIQLSITLLFAVAHSNGCHLQRATRTRLQHGGVILQNFKRALTYGAKPSDADA